MHIPIGCHRLISLHGITEEFGSGGTSGDIEFNPLLKAGLVDQVAHSLVQEVSWTKDGNPTTSLIPVPVSEQPFSLLLSASPHPSCAPAPALTPVFRSWHDDLWSWADAGSWKESPSASSSPHPISCLLVTCMDLLVSHEV